jgi:hypothetical protein
MEPKKPRLSRRYRMPSQRIKQKIVETKSIPHWRKVELRSLVVIKKYWSMMGECEWSMMIQSQRTKLQENPSAGGNLPKTTQTALRPGI